MAIWSGIVENSQSYRTSRGGAWNWSGFFCSQPLILPSTYECKTRQNATLTGQERQGGVQLKVCKLLFVIFGLLDYFSSWEIRRLIPFCPCYLHTLLLVSLCLHKFLCCCCPRSHWNFTAEFTGRWFKCLVLAARGYFNISSYLYFISHFFNYINLRSSLLLYKS